MANINPWEQKKWHGGQIRPNRGGVVVLLIMGVIFLTVGMLAVVNSENALKFPPNKENFALLFPFIGLCLLGFGVFILVRNRKWRGSKFVMETMPGVIGGKLTGTLVLCGDLGGDADIDITLVNEEQETSRTGKKSHTSTSYIFKHRMRVNSGQVLKKESGYALPGPQQFEIPLNVEIPFETKDQTDNHKSRRTSYRYQWKLLVKADMP